MSKLLHLKTISDLRGNLTVVEKEIPFQIKRVFYIYGVDDSERGGHRHKETFQAAICIKGSCKIYMNDGKDENTYNLTKPNECLLIDPEDWHTMFDFSEDAVLLVFASTLFDINDYIHDSY